MQIQDRYLDSGAGLSRPFHEYQFIFLETDAVQSYLDLVRKESL